MRDGAVAAYARRPVNPHRMAALETYAGPTVLDVGCGNGAYVAALLPDRQAFGADWEALPSWAEHPGRFAVALADRLPFADACFDTVSCFETLEHLPDPGRGLEEIRRVAHSSVILSVPNCEVSPAQRASGHIYHHWIDPTHVNFWTFDEFLALVQASGLAVVEANRVNAVDLRPLVAEAWASTPLTRRAVRGLLKLKKQREYAMTTLVVARPV